MLETNRFAYKQRRDLLLAGLNELGLSCEKPAGAFYAFPDVSRISKDSREAAEILLDRAQVATVPGIVFGAGRRITPALLIFHLAGNHRSRA